eukprot:3312535-Heterocapsa_arctica.AAC.1
MAASRAVALRSSRTPAKPSRSAGVTSAPKSAAFDLSALARAPWTKRKDSLPWEPEYAPRSSTGMTSGWPWGAEAAFSSVRSALLLSSLSFRIPTARVVRKRVSMASPVMDSGGTHRFRT